MIVRKVSLSEPTKEDQITEFSNALNAFLYSDNDVITIFADSGANITVRKPSGLFDKKFFILLQHDSQSESYKVSRDELVDKAAKLFDSFFIPASLEDMYNKAHKVAISNADELNHVLNIITHFRLARTSLANKVDALNNFYESKTGVTLWLGSRLNYVTIIEGLMHSYEVRFHGLSFGENDNKALSGLKADQLYSSIMDNSWFLLQDGEFDETDYYAYDPSEDLNGVIITDQKELCKVYHYYLDNVEQNPVMHVFFLDRGKRLSVSRNYMHQFDLCLVTDLSEITNIKNVTGYSLEKKLNEMWDINYNRVHCHKRPAEFCSEEEERAFANQLPSGIDKLYYDSEKATDIIMQIYRDARECAENHDNVHDYCCRYAQYNVHKSIYDPELLDLDVYYFNAHRTDSFTKLKSATDIASAMLKVLSYQLADGSRYKNIFGNEPDYKLITNSNLYYCSLNLDNLNFGQQCGKITENITNFLSSSFQEMVMIFGPQYILVGYDSQEKAKLSVLCYPGGAKPLIKTFDVEKPELIRVITDIFSRFDQSNDSFIYTDMADVVISENTTMECVVRQNQSTADPEFEKVTLSGMSISACAKVILEQTDKFLCGQISKISFEKDDSECRVSKFGEQIAVVTEMQNSEHAETDMIEGNELADLLMERLIF